MPDYRVEFGEGAWDTNIYRDGEQLKDVVEVSIHSQDYAQDIAVIVLKHALGAGTSHLKGKIYPTMCIEKGVCCLDKTAPIDVEAWIGVPKDLTRLMVDGVEVRGSISVTLGRHKHNERSRCHLEYVLPGNNEQYPIVLVTGSFQGVLEKVLEG